MRSRTHTAYHADADKSKLVTQIRAEMESHLHVIIYKSIYYFLLSYYCVGGFEYRGKYKRVGRFSFPFLYDKDKD